MKTQITKIQSIKTNSFPGDTFRRIDAVLSDGRKIPVLGIMKEEGVYINDRNTRIFKTVNEAKNYVRENINSFLNINNYI